MTKRPKARDGMISARTMRILRAHAQHIERLGRRAIADVIEIGRRLTDAKRRVGHRRFLCWLAAEFGWSERHARNFMHVYEQSLKSENFADLDLPVSALYLLAAPSVPDRALVEIARRVGEGEGLSVAEVKDMIANTRRMAPLGVMCRIARQILGEVRKPYRQPSDVPQIADRICADLCADWRLGDDLLRDHPNLRYIVRNLCSERLARCHEQIDDLQREIEKLERLHDHMAARLGPPNASATIASLEAAP